MVAAMALALIPSCALHIPARLVPETVAPSPRARAYAHYLTALSYLRENDRASAIDEFREVLRLDPGAERAATALATLYRVSGRHKDGLAVLEKAVAAGADSATIHIMLGTVYQVFGRRADAEQELRRAAEVEPDNAVSFVYLGDLLEKQKDLVDAAWAYEQAARLRPESALVRQKLGLVYTQMAQHNGDYDRAEVELRSATELQPASSESYFNLGFVLIHQGKPDEAERPLLMALGRNPSSVPIRRILAGLYCQLDRWDDAQEQYAAIAKLRPDERRFTQESAVVHMLAGRYSKALETLASLGGETAESAFTRMLNAGAELRLGRTEVAVDQARRIPSFSDETPIEAMLDTVSLFGETRLETMYRALLEELIDGGGRSEAIYLFLGRLLEHAQEQQAALEAFEHALAVNPDNSLTHYYLGAILELMDMHDDAATHLKRAIEIAPEKAEYYNHLGYMYAEQNTHLDEAFELLTNALELEPDNGYFLDSMGWIYYRKGQFDKALEYVRRALPNLQIDDPIVRDHLGDILFAAGRTDEALTEWRKAVTLDPSMESVTEKLETHGPRPDPCTP